jgi:hypothetical protein
MNNKQPGRGGGYYQNSMATEPGKGDDVPCSKCGAALDTGLECTECGHDMRPEIYPAAPGVAEQPAPAPQAPEVGVEPWLETAKQLIQDMVNAASWALSKQTAERRAARDKAYEDLIAHLSVAASQLSSLKESHEMLLKALNEAMGEIRACYEQMAGENHRFAPLLKVKIDRWDAAIRSAMAAKGDA